MATGDRYEPYRLVGADGVVVAAAAAFFRDLLAAGRAESTVRSYGMDLLRWFRFLRAAGVRLGSGDSCRGPRFLQVAAGCRQAGPAALARAVEPPARGGAVPAGEAYAPSVRAHSETVLRAFYDFHLDAGSGPIVNPFPLDRSRRGGRAHAHHNPMEPYRNERSGLYRPRVPDRIPRSVPDSEFNEIFAGLPSHRDRALVAFYVSTGARASELLSATLAGHRPGTAADHGGPEGHPRAAGAAGVHRRVRVAAALPGGDGGADSRRGGGSRCGGRSGARPGR